MRWIRRAGLAFAVLLVLVVAGGGVAALMLRPDSLKPRIAAVVRNATGRDLAIAGPIGLRLFPSPTLVLREVSLANRPGGSARPMLTLARLRVELEWSALLRGAVVVRRLDLDQPDILLEADKDGIGNWQMSPGAPVAPPAPKLAPVAPPAPASAPVAGKVSPPASGPAPAAPAKPATVPAGAGGPPDLAVRVVALHGGVVTMHNAVSGRGFSITIPDLELRGGAGDAPMTLDGAVALGARQLRLSLRSGALAALWSTAAPWPFQLDVTGDGVSLSVRGSAASPASGNGIGADIALKLDQTALLAGMVPGGLLPALHDLSASAHVSADITGDDGAARVSVSKLALSARELAASGTMGWAGAGAGLVSGKLDVARLDLDAISFVPAPAPAAPPPPASAPAPAAAPDAKSAPDPRPAPAQAAARGNWLIPDDPLPPALVSGPGLDLTLSVQSLTRRHAALGPVAMHVTRAGGRLNVAPLSVAMPGGTLVASLAASGAPADPDLAVSLDGQGMAAGPLLVQLGQPPLVTGSVDVHVRLSGRGGSPHAAASVASGEMGLAVVGGQIDTGIATGPLGPLLPQLGVSASQAAGRAALRCLAVAADVRGGQGHVGTLVLDSAMLFADGGGELSLRTEQVDLRIKPALRLPPVNGIQIPVRVSGPILHPEVGWDGPVMDGKAAFSAVIGALPQLGSPDRCAPALAAARFGRPGIAPAPAPSAFGPVEKGLDGLLPGLGHLLDQLR